MWNWRSFRTLSCVLLMGIVIPSHCLADKSVKGHPESGAVKTITLANGEWAPYQSAHLKFDGVVSRIVKAAFADQGIRVRYVFLPWKRAYYMALKGEFAGTLAWRETFERVREFWFSDAIFTGKTVLFHLKKQPLQWQSLKDLKGLRVGETLGYDYTPLDRAQALGLIRVERAATDNDNLKKLLHGRIDLFPSDLDVGLRLIQTRLTPAEAARITWSKKPLEVVNYHLMLSRQLPESPRLMKKFNVGMIHLRQKGLVHKWFEESRRGDYRLSSPAGEASP